MVNDSEVYTDAWTRDANEAIRFARKVDAQIAIKAFGLHEPDHFPTDHVWIGTHPQPPSIPEPSDEDVEAAILAFDLVGPQSEWRSKSMRAALTTYTARLRERIGGVA